MTGIHDSDKRFTGHVPEFYDSYLVPLIFEPYTADLAQRVALRSPARVLEIAAGTGVVTRALAETLPARAHIVATDLNQPMLDHAAAIGTSRPVEWRKADALRLPFPDESFDVVVCQFGVMFFPDKVKAYAEARRVLDEGGIFAFNVWDGLEENEFADVVHRAVASMFPDDPPAFLARIPYGYSNLAVVGHDLAEAGFRSRAQIETVAARSRAPSAREPAVAFVEGTPLVNEIEKRDGSRVEEGSIRATAAVAERFGNGPVDGKIQAHVILIEK